MNETIKRFHKPIKASFPAILLLLLSFYFYIPSNLSAQNKPENDKIDSLTYQLYMLQKWDDLIAEGKKAIHNGVDFYYLQMRIAIAFYEKRNYRQAIRYFENALRYDPLNQVVLEYLYFSYMLSGRDYDMRRIVQRLNATVRERNKIPVRRRILEQISLEGTLGFAANTPLKNENRQRVATDTIYTETWYYDNLEYLQTGFTLNVIPRVTTYQGYGRLVSDYSQEISSRGHPVEDFSDKALEDEYYGNVQIAAAKGLKVTPAWHFNWVKYGERRAFFDFSQQALMFDTTHWNKTNFTFSLSVLKELSDFSIEAFCHYSDFGLKILNQAGLAFYYYPFGNLDLYSRTSLEYVWYDSVNNFVFSQLIGTRLAKKAWFEAEATIGQLRDYAEKNAYIIYNPPEEINYKVESTILLNLNKHLDLSLRYRLMQRENSYLTYTDYFNTSIKKTNYFSHFLIGGITWRL